MFGPATGTSLLEDISSAYSMYRLLTFDLQFGADICLIVTVQHSFYILTLNLVKRINRLGGRPHSFIMSCPVASVLPNREQIQCDPEYIQVSADCSSTYLGQIFGNVFIFAVCRLGCFVILRRFVCVSR